MPGRLVVQQTDGGRHIIESPHVKAPSARAGVAFPGESRWSSHLDKNGFPIQIVTCVAVIRAILQTHELAPVPQPERARASAGWHESLRHRLRFGWETRFYRGGKTIYSPRGKQPLPERMGP